MNIATNYKNSNHYNWNEREESGTVVRIELKEKENIVNDEAEYHYGAKHINKDTLGFGGEGTVLNIPSKDIEDSHYDEKKYSISKSESENNREGAI